MAQTKASKLVANNKKAYFDYFIEDTYEAGIALVGTEVKSIRMGKCSIKESYMMDGGTSAPMEKPKPKEVYLTRPFIYMLIDVEANIPLFIGVMNDPGAK